MQQCTFLSRYRVRYRILEGTDGIRLDGISRAVVSRVKWTSGVATLGAAMSGIVISGRDPSAALVDWRSS